MRKRSLYFLGAALLVAFAGFAVTSFQQSLTPYVSYADARSSSRTVQIAGGLAEDSTSYDGDSEALYFTLEDAESGDTVRVRYHGLKPANFEDAISIVAIGRWDSQQELIVADKLLVKCPSKYQGIEEKTYS